MYPKILIRWPEFFILGFIGADRSKGYKQAKKIDE